MTLPELQEELGFRGFFGRILAKRVYKLLRLDDYNRLQAQNAEYTGAEFAARILEGIGVKYEIPEHQRDRIPLEGGFIVVSNHHYGSIDGLILEAFVGAKRPDLKILTTFMLTKIPGLRDNFIPVDNFKTGTVKSFSGIRASMAHISEGHPLGLFPAGEVATWQRGKNRTALGKGRIVEDIPWSGSIVKLISHAGLPVIPIYFDGGNSKLFHILGRIHPRLRTIRLIHEMFNKPGTTVQVRIGQPIPAAEIAKFDKLQLGQYLRSRVYALEAQCLPLPNLEQRTWPTPVAPPVDPELIRGEIAALADKKIHEDGDYRLYLIHAADAPHLMKELYRLREETFRAIGEGTGTPDDTDIYDARYYQLILWNIPNDEIAGAYRIGDCHAVMAEYGGIQGIYTASLVKYSPEAADILSTCLELGRSFVVAKYQREIHTLRLLFTGLALTAEHIQTSQYYLGPVSISNDYPRFYKSLITYFFQRERPMPDGERLVQPTHPFVPDFLKVDPDQLLLSVPKGDIEAFDRLLAAISDGKYRLPVLVRKYFTCSARIACFNVDPDFTDSLDGLIFLKHSDFPLNSMRSFVRGLPDESRDAVFMHFYGTTNPS